LFHLASQWAWYAGACIFDVRFIIILGFFFGHKSEVRRLDQTGTQETTYNLKPLSRIHDMAVTSDNNTIIAVGETRIRSDWETIPESAIAGGWSPPECDFKALNASI